jgi:hypothetical protein
MLSILASSSSKGLEKKSDGPKSALVGENKEGMTNFV